MKLKLDPQLHILRSVASSLDDIRVRNEATSARFQLFAALEMEDYPAAQRWLDALEISFATAGVFTDTALAPYANSVKRAIAAIRQDIGQESAQ